MYRGAIMGTNDIVEKKGIQSESNYTYLLPAHIDFGVTVLINTNCTHKVTIYIDDKAQSLVLSGTSTQNGTNKPNVTLSGVYNSGGGKVKVEVSVNGKPATKTKYAYGIFEMDPGLAVFATEDGSDNDFNDSIVILNWPLK